MTDPTFSVIVPTHNRSALLPECIAALRAQTYPEKGYEILLVDNGSDDDTAEMVARLNREPGKEVRYVFEEKPGLMDARHSGARHAEGEILAYTDDDGIADSGWLAALASAYLTLDADCAGGRILIRWDAQPPAWVVPYEGALARIDRGPSLRLLRPGEEIYGPNFSIRRSRLFEIGGFNPDQIGEHIIGDGETGLCRKIHDAGWRVAWVPDALVWHRQFVAKNAALFDLQRRYANNGVGNVYAKFKNGELPGEMLVGYSRRMRLRSLKFTLRALLHLPWQDAEFYRSRLHEARCRAESECALRLARDPEYRQLALRSDWIAER